MIATALLEAALRSLVMGAAVLAGLQMLRVRHVLARKLAWMLVLLASLAMPFLSRWQGVGVKPAGDVSKTGALLTLRVWTPPK